MLALVAAGDALMLGRVAQAEMTAVSLATQVQFVQNIFLMAIAGAGSILGAQYWGKGDRNTLQSLFNLMLRYALLLSLLFFCACEFIPGILMKAFTGDPELIAIGSAYLRIAGWSYLLTAVSQSYLAVMKVTDHVKPCAWISSAAVIINILLLILLCARHDNSPRALHIEGIRHKLRHFLNSLSDLIRRDRQLSHDFARQCFPLMGGSLLWGVGFTSYTAILGHMGVDAAAANSVAAVVRDLVCCACNGVGTAAGIMVGNELGAGNLELGKAYGIKLRNLSFVIGFASTALVLAVTPLVVRMVLLTDAARKELTGMMVIMAFYMIGRCVNTITINGVLDGGGDTVFDVYSLAVCMWGIAIPLALLGAFVFHWPVLLVYACTCLDEVGKIPWVMLRVKKYKWVRNLTRA